MDIKVRCIKSMRHKDSKTQLLIETFTKDKVYDAQVGVVGSITAIDNNGRTHLLVMCPWIKHNRNYFKRNFIIKSPYTIRSRFKR